MKKKATYDEALSFVKFRLDSLERQFKETSDRFIWQIQQGGGINNIHMLDTIRALNFLYAEIAAHRDALRSMKVEF